MSTFSKPFQAHKNTHKSGGADEFVAADVLKAAASGLRDTVNGVTYPALNLAPNAARRQSLRTDGVGNIEAVDAGTVLRLSAPITVNDSDVYTALKTVVFGTYSGVRVLLGVHILIDTVAGAGFKIRINLSSVGATGSLELLTVLVRNLTTGAIEMLSIDGATLALAGLTYGGGGTQYDVFVHGTLAQVGGAGISAWVFEGAQNVATVGDTVFKVPGTFSLFRFLSNP